MLSLEHLSLRRGVRLLIEDATLAVHPGQKVGLTGANGTGKSSLFALIQGQLTADAGELRLPSGWVLAHVAQEIPAEDTPAIDYVMAGDAELTALQAALARAEADGEGRRIGELHARLDAIGGYGARARAARLMHGLGFEAAQEGVPVRTLSGGWRMRLNLARALMCRSDLLLLDEPTNHLDLDAVLWLQEWLRAYPGTLLLISHDREFLDEVVDHVLHLEGQRLTLYAGNYSAFERRRAERLAEQQAAYERQQREMAHIQGFVDRFRAKATKARQAQSRIKALERLQLVAPAHVDSPFHFEFPNPLKVPDPLIQLEGVALGYGERTVLRGIRLALGAGERVALLGRNGAGKSTLVKLLAGLIEPCAGELRRAPDLAVGYFAQHQLEQLDPAASPVQHLLRQTPALSDQAARDFLGGFGFVGDAALAPVGPFSGGEKARLALALIAHRRPNLLLLDEPTNHLDLEMRHALALALQDYEGSLVVVSHDRSLLRSVADRLVLVADGGVGEFDGDLADYAAWLARKEPAADAAQAAPTEAQHTANARKDRRRREAEQREALRPLRREVERWEARLAKLSEERAALEAALADPSLYEADHKVRLRDLLARQAELARSLDEAESGWLEASEALETAQARLDA